MQRVRRPQAVVVEHRSVAAATGGDAGASHCLTAAGASGSRRVIRAATEADSEHLAWVRRVRPPAVVSKIRSDRSEIVHDRVVHGWPHARDGIVLRAWVNPIRQQDNVDGPIGINPQRRPRETNVTERPR